MNVTAARTGAPVDQAAPTQHQMDEARASSDGAGRARPGGRRRGRRQARLGDGAPRHALAAAPAEGDAEPAGRTARRCRRRGRRQVADGAPRHCCGEKETPSQRDGHRAGTRKASRVPAQFCPSSRSCSRPKIYSIASTPQERRATTLLAARAALPRRRRSRRSRSRLREVLFAFHYA